MDRRRPATDEVAVEVVARVAGMGGGTGCSGVVVERGAEAAALAIGDDVFGTTTGGQSDEGRVICRSDRLARKPAGLAHAEAAALAAFGPSALLAVRSSGTLPGDRVLITGASTGVGALAVQIAKARDLRVTATCGDRDVPLVWDLGADEVHARERDLPGAASFTAVIDTEESVMADVALRVLEPYGRSIAVRDGLVLLSVARGTLVTVGVASPHEVSPLELVTLVERDRVFPR